MFIFERVFAVGIYAIVLLVMCLLISQKNSNYKRILVGYTIILSVMGFFYLPYKTSDLYRIYDILRRYSGYNWDYFFTNVIGGNLLGIDAIYYWLIAQTGEIRLLPAINAFLCYSCVFYIIIRTAKLYNINRNNIAIAVFFFMSIGNYMFVISGIRSMLGICLLAFCFFRESVEKKFKVWHILLYIISAFIHNFTFVLIFIRLCVPVITKKLPLGKKILHLFILGISAVLVLYFTPQYIREVLNRGEGYISGDKYSYIWEYITGILTGIIIAIAVYNMRNIKADINKDFRQTKIFIATCLCIALVFSFEFSIFHRTIAYIAPILCLPVIMVTRQREISKRNNDIWIILTVLLFITCARGSLCSLKFFVL